MSHPKEIWGQLGVWSTFLNTNKILLTFIDKFFVFYHFRHFLFSCIRCSFGQNTRNFIVYLRNLSDINNFLVLFVIFRDIFLGAYSVWTLSFSVWIRPWLHRHCQKFSIRKDSNGQCCEEWSKPERIIWKLSRRESPKCQTY